jgi:4-hydroxybenzoate polyprenyltransferase
MQSEAAEPLQKTRATFLDYVALARLDHATKHVFILPGIALAVVLRGVHSPNLLLSIFVGFVAAVCIASANYVINEYLDREFDRHHPTKSARLSVQREVRGSMVFVEWLLLLVVGLSMAAAGGTAMFFVGCAFAAQGIIYNVRPIRSKEVPFLDVISEAVNNPLRLMIGWVMIDPTTLPPGSIILAFWFGGAFLMGSKRLSEYREITASHGRELLARYRRSFAGYSETSLTVSCLAYALFSIGFLSIFLIKYRIEYLICLPLIVWLFAHYLAISMQAGSSAQSPEKLFRERGLLLVAGLLGSLFIIFTFVDVPVLEELTSQSYIEIR